MANTPTTLCSQIPRGVGACPPPGMDLRKGRGKLMCIKVRMLDDSVAVFHLGHKATGQNLFDEVCRHLNLLESDYFGLEYIDGSGNRCWLDKDKSILRQITTSRSDARFYFIVKFYTPNPADLEEDYTRYLFSLQIKRDLARGELICNESTAALLASYIVQAECGDYSAADYPDHNYLSATNFVPNQTAAFQIKVMDNHKRLIGMTPAEADLSFIEIARRCDYYGIKLHSAKDVEGTDVNLSVAHMGIKVFHQLNCVATFSWAKIRKICFKRKRLMIKVHAESVQCYKETIEFLFESRNECKNFWKKCVEHHSFFRCIEAIPSKCESNLIFSRGSTFRYHGRTQKQLIDYVREHRKRREPFQRPLHVSSVPRETSISSNGMGFHGRLLLASADPMYNENERQKNFSMMNGTAQLRRIDDEAAYSQQSIFPSYSRIGVNYEEQQRRMQRPLSVQQQTTTNLMNELVSTMETRKRTLNETNEPSEAPSYKFGTGFKKRQERLDSLPRQSDTPQQSDDIMSTSLPNVLATDFYHSLNMNIDKSVSGENFHVPSTSGQQTNRRHSCDYDNDSEGSYKCSSIPDVPAYAQVLNTTFTTKRVGDVIIKKVNDRPRHQNSKERVGSSEADRSKWDENQSSSFSIASAPLVTTASNNSANKKIFVNRSKYMDIQSKIRSEVPIQIDGPKESSAASSIANNRNRVDDSSEQLRQCRIIRPVMISEKLKKSSVVANKSCSSARKPVVVRSCSGGTLLKESNEEGQADATTMMNAQSEMEAKIQPIDGGIEMPNSFVEKVNHQTGSDNMLKDQISTQKNLSQHADGQVITGRIITRESLVVTPKGIDILNKPISNDNKPSTPNEKPKVPPKPVLTTQNSAEKSPNCEKPILSLDNILEEVRSINQVLTEIENENQVPNRAPAMVSVESFDTPNVKKIHLFGNIPYTLHLRNFDSTTSDSTTPTEGSNESTGRKCINAERHQLFNGHHLVHKKSLPNQSSFSSQDHSVSPTNPDTGNVIEYICRRRSLSNERNSQSANRRNASASALRRRTEPISISSSVQLREITIIPNKVEQSEMVVKIENSTRPMDHTQKIVDPSAQTMSSDMPTSKESESDLPSKVNKILETDF